LKIIDSSAIGAVLFGEPEAERMIEWIAGESLVAPTLVDYEVANICWKKLRQHPEKRESLIEAYSLFPRMALNRRRVSFPDVLALAEAERLTVYDASYLWLSRSLGLELITLDGDLLTAARKGFDLP
jgi:predicted nucleic acid-binding protein